MKTLLTLIFMLVTMEAFALPVVNENIAPPGFKLVVWRDHLSPSKLYILPKGFRTEERYQWGFRRKENVLHMSFKHDYDMNEIYRLKDYFFLRKEYYEYGEVEFEQQELNLGTILDDFLVSKKCWNFTDTMIAHVEFYSAAFYFHCNFALNETGEYHLLLHLLKGESIALNANLRLQGVKKTIDGTYVPLTFSMGLPVIMKRPARDAGLDD